MLEEAKRRDHRKIGAEMGQFALDPEYTGPGMPLWLPKGPVLVEDVECIGDSYPGFEAALNRLGVEMEED